METLSKAQAMMNLRKAGEDLEEALATRTTEAEQDRESIQAEVKQIDHQMENTRCRMQRAAVRLGELPHAVIKDGEMAKKVPRYRPMQQDELAEARRPQEQVLADEQQELSGLVRHSEYLEAELSQLLGDLPQRIRLVQEQIADLELLLNDTDWQELGEMELEQALAEYKTLLKQQRAALITDRGMGGKYPSDALDRIKRESSDFVKRANTQDVPVEERVEMVTSMNARMRSEIEQPESK